MLRIRRFKRCRRLTLFAVGILVFVLYFKYFKQRFSPGSIEAKLQSNEKNLPIISPSVEPQLGHDFKESLFLLVVVSSSPNKQENADRRKMLRKTWGDIKDTRVAKDIRWKVVFVMGKPQDHEMNEAIMAEHRSQGDLLIGDYKDEYRSITTKLLMAFQWASKLKCSYVLKTDDDVYIDIPKLIEWLIARGDANPLYGGVLYNGHVVRDKTHRHYVSEELLSLDYYPVFCKGSMFVISWSLVPKMVDLSKHIKRIGPDDAYIGLLAYQLGIKPVKIQGFLQTSFTPWFVSLISTCQMQEIMGIGDSLAPGQMYYIHQHKISVLNREKVHTVCISLFTELLLLLLLCCTFLLIFCCRLKRRIRVKT